MRGGEKMKRINENALVFNGTIKQNSVRYTIAFVKENRGGRGMRQMVVMRNTNHRKKGKE